MKTEDQRTVEYKSLTLIISYTTSSLLSDITRWCDGDVLSNFNMKTWWHNSECWQRKIELILMKTLHIDTGNAGFRSNRCQLLNSTYCAFTKWTWRRVSDMTVTDQYICDSLYLDHTSHWYCDNRLCPQLKPGPVLSFDQTFLITSSLYPHITFQTKVLAWDQIYFYPFCWMFMFNFLLQSLKCNIQYASVL